MRTSPFWLLGILVLTAGCAHKPLSGRNLDRVHRPAFISRIEENAGPRARVFREDSSYGGKLKKLEPKEADRRLGVKLGDGMTRFEVSDGLRSKVYAKLPQESPWTNVLEPVIVARQLESFLVDEVPANPPDYELLRPQGVDAIVEFVIEDYGMRSRNGRAGVYIVGYGRMFYLDGGEIWRRSFTSDQVENEAPHLDPFKVAKEKGIPFRNEMNAVLDAVAQQFAADLTPPDRRPPVLDQSGAQSDDTHRTGKEGSPRKKPGSENELPDPDPI